MTNGRANPPTPSVMTRQLHHPITIINLAIMGCSQPFSRGSMSSRRARQSIYTSAGYYSALREGMTSTLTFPTLSLPAGTTVRVGKHDYLVNWSFSSGRTAARQEFTRLSPEPPAAPTGKSARASGKGGSSRHHSHLHPRPRHQDDPHGPPQEPHPHAFGQLPSARPRPGAPSARVHHRRHGGHHGGRHGGRHGSRHAGHGGAKGAGADGGDVANARAGQSGKRLAVPSREESSASVVGDGFTGRAAAAREAFLRQKGSSASGSGMGASAIGLGGRTPLISDESMQSLLHSSFSLLGGDAHRGTGGLGTPRLHRPQYAHGPPPSAAANRRKFPQIVREQSSSRVSKPPSSATGRTLSSRSFSMRSLRGQESTVSLAGDAGGGGGGGGGGVDGACNGQARRIGGRGAGAARGRRGRRSTDAEVDPVLDAIRKPRGLPSSYFFQGAYTPEDLAAAEERFKAYRAWAKADIQQRREAEAAADRDTAKRKEEDAKVGFCVAVCVCMCGLSVGVFKKGGTAECYGGCCACASLLNAANPSYPRSSPGLFLPTSGY